MDVLRPPLIWVDGRCYRTTSISDVKPQETISESFHDVRAIDDDGFVDDEPTANCSTLEPKLTQNGQYELTIDVPRHFCGKVVGANGVVKKRIESETKTTLRVPRTYDEDRLTLIRGISRNGVERAYHIIQRMMKGTREKTGDDVKTIDDFVREEPTANCPNTEPNLNESGHYELSIDIPRSLRGGVIGTSGFLKTKIENQTETTIDIPRFHSDDSVTVIRGSSRSSVEKAFSIIQGIMKGLRERSSESFQKEDDAEYVDDEPISNGSTLEPKLTENGQYKLTMNIPNPLCGNVIGAKGAVTKRIENETGTTISIVKSQDEDRHTVIKGSTRSGVESAFNRIQLIMESSRKNLPFTHFVSLPINAETIKNRFQEFKNQVMDTCKSDIREKLFQYPSKLHLTIVPLVLLNDSERTKAAEILRDGGENVVKAVLRSDRLVVRMKGIEIMNDDPSEVDVLYAKVLPTDGSHRLQLLADMLVEKFVGSGLMQYWQKRENVKLHVTLMNSRFDDQSIVDDGTKMQRRESFDSRRIFELFKDFDFGEMHLDFVHLSRRHSSGKDGYYTATTKLQLP